MGEPISLTRGAESWSVQGIFQESHIAVDPDTGLPVSTQQPVVGLNLRDLPTKPKAGDFVTARGLDYRIRDVQPDGHTGLTVLLQRTGARNPNAPTQDDP